MLMKGKGPKRKGYIQNYVRPTYKFYTFFIKVKVTKTTFINSISYYLPQLPANVLLNDHYISYNTLNRTLQLEVDIGATILNSTTTTILLIPTIIPNVYKSDSKLNLHLSIPDSRLGPGYY